MSNLLNRQRASDAAPDLQGLSRTQARDQVIEQFMETPTLAMTYT